MNLLYKRLTWVGWHHSAGRSRYYSVAVNCGAIRIKVKPLNVTVRQASKRTGITGHAMNVVGTEERRTARTKGTASRVTAA